MSLEGACLSQLVSSSGLQIRIGVAVFDVKKLVEAILTFVNFFVVRIAMACAVAGLIYRISGYYYFDILRTGISNTPLSAQEVQSYIAKAADYVSESNIKNAIFVVSVIVCLSLLDILYRFVGKLGSLLPIMMLSNYRYVTDQFRDRILANVETLFRSIR
jgi:hypothetical protein